MSNESIDISDLNWRNIINFKLPDDLSIIPKDFPKKSVFQDNLQKQKEEALRIKDEKIAEILIRGWSSVLKAENYPKSDLSKDFFMMLIRFSREIGTDPLEFSAIIMKESRFDPNKSGGIYFGLIQMDKTSFNNDVKSMIEYEQYCKDNPNKNISIDDYEILSSKKGFKKPFCSDMISFEQYKKLSREKQIKYSEYYIKFWINKKGLKGQKLSGKEVWALIHSPAKFDSKTELRQREIKLNKIMNIFPSDFSEQLKNLNQIDLLS